MKFEIERASSISNYSPCEEAKKEVDEQIKQEIKEKYGKNYISTCGEFYTIEINTLEELYDFIKKYGDIIIYEKSYNASGLLQIVIYDSHVE